ncbi:hypothetical protein [Emticicia sp. SJ17W-69]|uniref:hypothetical protein n=1 Tax=Emticicia sp. SJ17W-69 TaxID=3421657 RepID=UPI003EBAD0C6
MKSSIKQVSEDISEALFEVISIAKVGKKLKKAVKKASITIAKKVIKLKKKEAKKQEKAEQLAIKATRILVPRLAKTSTKKVVTVPKTRPVKLKITS